MHRRTKETSGVKEEKTSRSVFESKKASGVSSVFLLEKGSRANELAT